MKFSQLIQALSATIARSSREQLPDLDPDITGVSAVDEAVPGTVSYVDGDKFAAAVQTTIATALILPLSEELQATATQRGIAWVATDQPRLAFAQAIAVFYQPFRPVAEVHPTAIVHPMAKLGQNVAIGAHVSIQADVVIGDGVCIHPNVVIYPGVRIGDRTILHANATIHERSQIGADCVIHSGVVIGSEGFGFVPTPQGLVKMEQSGLVVLEDGVEIGCNSCVDRPATGETRIGRNTKIDNLVQIAHGCRIGHNCAIAAQTGLAGRVTLGNGVMLGGQVGIANQITVGDGAMVYAQAGIQADVEAKAVVCGTPAISARTWFRSIAMFHRLPEFYKLLRQLQQ